MISNEILLRAAIALGGAIVGAVVAIFTAGRVYASVLQKQEKDRADINGLGKKYGRLVALLMRWADTDDKRAQVANVIEGKDPE